MTWQPISTPREYCEVLFYGKDKDGDDAWTVGSLLTSDNEIWHGGTLITVTHWKPLDVPQADGAVDPHADSTGNTSTRD